VEEIFAQGHTFAAWKIKKDVGKKTLADVKRIEHELKEKEEPVEEKGVV